MLSCLLEPSPYGAEELTPFDGLAEMVVHAGPEEARNLFRIDVCGQRDDRKEATGSPSARMRCVA